LFRYTEDKVNQSHQKTSERHFEAKVSAPVIDVVPALNTQTLIVVVLRLTALNFFLRIFVEISTPLLTAAGVYRHSPDDAPLMIGWGLVGCLLLGAILLWALALPVAKLVAKGVPLELSLGDLTLADCYAIAFIGLGTVYIVSHLAPVWNWTAFMVQSLIHGPRYPWSDRTRGYQIATAFLPFIAGIVMVIRGRKWALKLAGAHTHNTVISFRESRMNPSEPIKVSIESKLK
jgi:hypothetical protein